MNNVYTHSASVYYVMRKEGLDVTAFRKSINVGLGHMRKVIKGKHQFTVRELESLIAKYPYMENQIEKVQK